MTASARESFEQERTAWLQRIGSLHFAEQIFGCLRDASFFAKDIEGRFMMADKSFLAILRCDSLEEILGKTDEDFFAPHLAKKYQDDDRRVMETREPLQHEIEVVSRDDLSLFWHEASKFPIFDTNDEVIGVAGVTVKLSPRYMPLDFSPSLGKILEYIGDNYGSKITIKQLAEIANLSERSLERHFMKAFKTTPLRYLKQVRINAACHALSHTSKTISEITFECGFSDQSHMTSEFKRVLDITPRAYRLQNA